MTARNIGYGRQFSEIPSAALGDLKGVENNEEFKKAKIWLLDDKLATAIALRYKVGSKKYLKATEELDAANTIESLLELAEKFEINIDQEAIDTKAIALFRKKGNIPYDSKVHSEDQFMAYDPKRDGKLN